MRPQPVLSASTFVCVLALSLAAGCGSSGTPPGKSSCPTGSLACGGHCVDPETDQANCGTCGNACNAGEVCAAGTCAVSCPKGEVECGGKCIDPTSNRAYCGATADCTGKNAGTACAAGQICGDGLCAATCPTGEIVCGGKCVDPSTNPGYCGATADCTGKNAGTACPAGQLCVSGACATSCPKGEIACGGKCIDPATDNTYCGATADCTGSNAGTTCGAGQACVSGACATSCPQGEIVCGGKCIDPTIDNAHCGATADCTGSNAGTACAAGQVCDAGGCTATCGSAFATCPATATTGPYCADTQTDPANCGSCGNACTPKNAAAPACAGGNCGYTSCKAGFGDCNGNTADGCETNTATDVNDCGACGVVCSPLNAAASTCTAGVCGYTTCNTGFGDCDGSTANGCESNLMTDVFNCGACGTVCQGGEVCDNGTCTYAPTQLTPMASLISMGGDGTSITLSRPRNVAFTLAAPAPATIYYTTNGSTPTKGAAGTTAAPAPVSLAPMGTTTIKWYADYGSAVEPSVHTMTYTLGTSHNLSWIAEGLDFSPTGGGAKGPIVTAKPGQALKATVKWQAWSSDSLGHCPGCVVQFALGADGAGQLFCHNDLVAYPGASGTATLTFHAPTKAGVYYVRGGDGENYTCAQTGYSRTWTEIGEVIVP